MFKVVNERKDFKKSFLSCSFKNEEISSKSSCLNIVFHCNGFTLVEVMAVVVILGILTTIASLAVLGSIEKAKREVCFTNTQQLERHYEAYLFSEGISHSNTVFIKYIGDYGEGICPENGEIRYEDGEVHCSLHPRIEEDGDDTEESVPYL